MIADTTVLSNFALVDRLGIPFKVVDIYTTNEVLNELKVCVTHGVFKLDLERSNLETLTLENEEITTFKRLNHRFGKGESSCLAVCLHRGFGILTDDFDARRFAQRASLPVSGSIGILVKAVDKGIISKEEGDDLLQRMIEKGFYSPVETLNSFFL